MTRRPVYRGQAFRRSHERLYRFCPRPEALESIYGCNPVARIDCSDDLVRIITNTGRTLETRVVAAQDAGDGGVSVFLPIENRTYISGDGVAQNLGADRTSRDYRKHLWQRVFAF